MKCRPRFIGLSVPADSSFHLGLGANRWRSSHEKAVIWTACLEKMVASEPSFEAPCWARALTMKAFNFTLWERRATPLTGNSPMLKAGWPHLEKWRRRRYPALAKCLIGKSTEVSSWISVLLLAFS